MESPQTWGLAEHVVNKALDQFFADFRNDIPGMSAVRMITDALRAEGLLKDD